MVSATGSEHEGGQPHQRCSVVVTDLDGTLLLSASTRNEPRVSDGNLKALRKAMDRGVPVCFATGRIPGVWDEKLRSLLPGLGPGVYGNGILVLDKDGGVLHEAVLPPRAVELAEAFFRGGRARTGGRVAVLASTRWPDEVAGPLQYLELAPSGRSAVPPQVLETLTRSTFEGLALRPVHKFIVLAGPVGGNGATGGHAGQAWASAAEAVEGVREALQGVDVTILQYGGRFFEILPPGTSKASGLRVLLQALGGEYTPEQVLACGDEDNDLDLLRLAGVGVAMGNGTEATRAAADVVVGNSDEDGVAEAVHRFVLEEEFQRK